MAPKPNLFAAAKAKGATAPEKSGKVEVVIKDAQFHQDLSRLAEINSEVDRLNAEAAVLAGITKERGIKEFANLYETSGKYPGSFNVRGTGLKGMPDASFMFIPTDKYIKIGEDRYKELVEQFGEEIAEEKTTYVMDAELIEKYGELLSEAIHKIKGISDDDKAKLIKAQTSYNIRKGTISDLAKYPVRITEMLEEIKPVYQSKNVKIEDTL